MLTIGWWMFAHLRNLYVSYVFALHVIYIVDIYIFVTERANYKNRVRFVQGWGVQKKGEISLKVEEAESMQYLLLFN